MKNKIWFKFNWVRAELKEMIGMKLTPFDEFILEIGS